MFAKSLLISLALAAASVKAGIYVSTPATIKQCEPVEFTVDGVKGSYWPFIVDPKKPCDDALKEFDDHSGNFKWTPDLDVGTSVMFAIEDEAGNEAYSGAVTIQAGSSTACLNKSVSASSTKTATTSTSTNDVKILGGADTPANAVDAPVNAASGGAAHVVALSGATVFTVLSAFALAL